VRLGFLGETVTALLRAEWRNDCRARRWTGYAATRSADLGAAPGRRARNSA